MAGMPNRILSPQHFAQAANDHHPQPEGTGSITNSKNIALFWGQQRYTKTILLDKRLNIGLTWMAPGSEAFTAYLATMPKDREDGIQAFVSHVILDDADSDDDASLQPKDPVQVLDVDREEPHVDTRTTIQEDEGATTKFSMQDLADLHVIPHDEQPTTLSAQDELIRWHHRLGHLPFDCIRSMSQKGILLKWLLKCNKPLCAACQYGKLTSQEALAIEREGNEPNQEGNLIRTDRLRRPTRVLNSRIHCSTQGKLTTQRYRYATVCGPTFAVRLCLATMDYHQCRDCPSQAKL